MGGQYGLSFSGSSSATSGLSGATSNEGGGAFGSITYGPGSVVNVPESSATLSTGTLALVGIGIAAALYFATR